MKKIYYRATSEPFKPDDVMPPGDDHIHSSKQAIQLGEKRLRSLRPDLAKLRANSLYLFGDKDRAIRYWALSGGRTLYEVEADEVDIRHEGDMQLIE